MKISKLLPITLAIVLSINCAFAAGTATKKTAQADYELTLPAFFNVTHNPTNVTSNVSYDVEGTYTTAKIDTNLQGNYRIVTNETTDLYVHATCKAKGGSPTHALFKNGTIGKDSSLWLVFTNTTPENAEHVATADQISSMITANDPTVSPNAVAFPLSLGHVIVEGTYPTGATVTNPTDVTTGYLKYTVPNCNIDFNYTVSGNSAPGTFSTLDQKGRYQATLYVSNAVPTL